MAYILLKEESSMQFYMHSREAWKVTVQTIYTMGQPCVTPSSSTHMQRWADPEIIY